MTSYEGTTTSWRHRNTVTGKYVKRTFSVRSIKMRANLWRHPKRPAVLQLITIAIICILPMGVNSLSFQDASSPSLVSGRTIHISGEQDETLPLHPRDRREAEPHTNSTSFEIVSNMASSFYLGSSHLNLIVHWASEGSPVVFTLAKDPQSSASSTSNFYISKDFGRTFTDVSERFRLSDGRVAILEKIFHHPAKNCIYIFTDVIHRHVFTTKDCGETVQSMSLDVDITPSKVVFDERKDSTFLIHDLVAENKPLYVTEDFGASLSHVSDYVKSFFLRYNYSKTDIFLQRYKPTKKTSSNKPMTTIFSSSSYFQRKSDTEIVYQDAVDFHVVGDFMFVTTYSAETTTTLDAPLFLDLKIAFQGVKFVPANFELCRQNCPQSTSQGVDDNNGLLRRLDYHIVDVTEDGQVMIVVNHDKTLSNLYVSNRITPYQVDFSLSLERVVYYHPNITWKDSLLASAAGDESFADVYKVRGLRGIYIASQITPEAWKRFQNIDSQVLPEDLVTLITFNQGGLWTKIKPPLTDDEGLKLDCDVRTNKKCSLHLSQELARKFPSSRSVPVMSSRSAVGIVIGSGNVGTSLKRRRTNVYLSADAGLSWHQVLKGSYYFNVGDHGGIIVAAKYFKTEGMTNELLYSTDEGIHWKSITFYEEPLRIFGLITEPGENTTMFTMYGSLNSARGIDWIIITVDLKSVFSHECTADDYKRWSPSDNTKGKHRSCILGRKETYERRMVNSNCYNGKRYERLITVEICGCERSDYMCDFGFTKDTKGGSACIRDQSYSHTSLDIYAPPNNCQPGEFYNQTRGYVKIRGDTCAGGLAKRFEPQVLGCPLKEEKDFMLVAQRLKVVRVNLRDTKQVEVLPLPEVQNVIALEYDLEDRCLIYGDISVDKIFMSCENNGSTEVLVDDNESVEGMSLDWISKALYFVDGMKKRIEMVQLGHGGQGGRIGRRWRKTILDMQTLSKPRGIAVHPEHGYLFYTDWDDVNPRVGRADMDGSNPIVLFKSPIVHWPNGLAIDYVANRIYWADAQKDFIASSDFDGTDFKRVLANVPQVDHPFAVGVFKDLVYWDDWKTKSVYTADKNSGNGAREIVTGMSGAMGLKMVSHLHRGGTSGCSNNKCKFLCVPIPQGHKCLCPDGMKSLVSEDGVSVDCVCPDDSVSETGTCLKQPNGICLSSQFACDNGFCLPKNWRCDGSNDCGDSSDERGCLDNQRCDPNTKFACSSLNPDMTAQVQCIPISWKCDFDFDCADGSDEADCTAAECSPTQFRCANGQCINKKFVCDLERDCQDGSDELNCNQRDNNTSGASNCSSIQEEGSQEQQSFCGANKFFCSSFCKCIPKSWRCDGQVDCPNGEDESDEECKNDVCKDWQFTCVQDGFCVFATWRCDGDKDCNDGSDELNCTSESKGVLTNPPPVFPTGQCTDWMFKCQDEQCIPYWWKCDGTKDCTDGSDETDCPSDERISEDKDLSVKEPPNHEQSCNADSFECLNGACIYMSWVCDGDNDCNEGEDEDPETCKDHVSCTLGQYLCVHSGECIDYHKVCDGYVDCSDSSDELGCRPPHRDGSNESQEPVGNCKPEEFSCDDSVCFPSSKICDGISDCMDNADEMACPDPSYKVRGLEAGKTTSNSVRVDWWIEDIEDADVIMYQPAYSPEGSTHWAQMPSQKIMEHFYVFENLHPYTRYKFKMNMLYEGIVYEDPSFIEHRTSPAPSGPPFITRVAQVQQDILVQWTKPAQENGVLKFYNVDMYAFDATDTNLTRYILESSPPIRSWRRIEHPNTELRVKGDDTSLEPRTLYAFVVRAENSAFSNGQPSEPKAIVYDRFDVLVAVENFSIETIRENRVVLSWKRPEIFASLDLSRPRNVLQYRLRVQEADQRGAAEVIKYDDVLVNGTSTTALVTGLSPGTSYVITMSPIKNDLVGPTVNIRVRTTGVKLPRVLISEATTTPQSGTDIKLTWQLPPDVKGQDSQKWKYAVFYGRNLYELMGRGDLSSSSTATFRNLQSCETYTFFVCIVLEGQLQVSGAQGGYGPPSPPHSYSTKFSPGAPPKNVVARYVEMEDGIRTRKIVVSWDASCPLVGTNLNYELHVEDVTMSSKKNFQILGQINQLHFRHEFKTNIWYGAIYKISVRTDVTDSIVSDAVTVHTPPIPEPVALVTYPDTNLSLHRIRWKKPSVDKLPDYLKKELLDSKVTYRINISTSDNEGHKIYDTFEPYYELPMQDLPPGKVNYVTVTMLDSNGYESRPSSAITIESPVPDEDIVVSSTNALGVLIAIVIVMSLLGIGLTYYVVKHRRLRRSFQEFVSKYSAASGGASIVNHVSLLRSAATANSTNLEEDEDDYAAPIIRGFADDEPLVVS